MMEMWLKRSTLLLLTVAALVISDQAPVILDETPRNKVEVPFGSSLTFHCRLETNTKERLRVFWYFIPYGSPSNGSRKIYEEMVNKSAKTSTIKPNQEDGGRDTEETLATYTLSNATNNDSGWYFCKVTIEIPSLNHINSSGREVVITKSIEHTTYPSLTIATGKPETVSPTKDFPLMDLWMWILLGVSVPILIILLVICVLLKKKYSRNQGEEPIYANTRPNPSPRPADKLKTVSSSQNLRDPSPSRKYEVGNRRYK